MKITTSQTENHSGEEIAEPTHMRLAREYDEEPVVLPDDYPFTDTGNAQRLLKRYGKNLKFVANWKKWIWFDGQRWQKDEIKHTEWLAVQTMRSLWRVQLPNDEDGQAKAKLKAFAHKSEMRNGIQNMVFMASAMEGATITPDALDSDPWLLNVKNGTVDLRTGELRLHRREDFITRMCPVEYDPSATCPTFESFMDKIFGGNEELIEFIRRILGYSLTGDTSEKSLFIFHGSGQNGKSTLLDVVRKILGEFSANVATETLMVKREGAQTNDIARLQGKRFITVSEVDEGRRLAEGLVKQMTGHTDLITARYLYGEPFEFRPEFKIFIATNNKPKVGSDQAVWNRIKLIPFDVRISDEERDPEMPEKLERELPGIFAWMVQGCRDWQEGGLQVPQVVQAATAQYQQEMDEIAEFIAAECVTGNPNLRVGATPLYERFKIWCGLSNIPCMTQTAFGGKVEAKGYVRDEKRDNFGRVQRIGIGLRVSEQLTQLEQ